MYTNRRTDIVLYLMVIIITPDRRQSRTIFNLQVNRSRLPNKAFLIAKTTIAERKLDVFDCH